MADRNNSGGFSRECIETALFIIMKTKPYDEITITDIAEKAGVSRMAYYRNYKDKEDILFRFLEKSIMQKINKCRSEDGIISFKKIIHATAEFFSDNNQVMAGILGSNIMGTLMTKVEDEIVNYFPHILDNRYDAYTAVFYSGAIVSVFRAWSELGMKESVDEITNLICGIIGDGVMNMFEKKMN